MFILINRFYNTSIRRIKMSRKIISIDLDGVLNTYCGKFEKDVLPPVKEGAYEFLQKLSENYDIEIYTVRDKHITKNWLKQNNLLNFIKNITDKKNRYATVFLDDRAVHFDGCFNTAIRKISSFKPHWK